MIRQARRQQNLTQTQLGGTHYSKSYVSALERGKIVPSSQALEYFTEQLGLSTSLSPTPFGEVQFIHQSNTGTQPGTITIEADQYIPNEAWHFLDTVIEQFHRIDPQALHTYPTLTLEEISSLPSKRQASYSFILGIMAQQKGDVDTALRALEHALALSSSRQQSSILDILGNIYSSQHAHTLALHYHLRAYQLLKNEASEAESAPSALLLDVTLHSGDDYQALANYKRACAMYEEGRLLLTVEHGMKLTGNLYLGLGYCTYALIYQAIMNASRSANQISQEEIEQQFQSASSYLLQSITISQISRDKRKEAAAVLLLSKLMIDWSARLRLVQENRGSTTSAAVDARCSSLLDQAQEYSRQLLLTAQRDFENSESLSVQEEAVIYSALSIIARVSTQRAIIARLSNHSRTAARELTLASSLCRSVLNRLQAGAFPRAEIDLALSIRSNYSISPPPTLPIFSEEAHDRSKPGALSKSELYLAAGEVAEELGRSATNEAYAHHCYQSADTFFRKAIECVHTATMRHDCDPGYLLRVYQRFIALLEERSLQAERGKDATADVLLELLKVEISTLPDLLLLPLSENA